MIKAAGVHDGVPLLVLGFTGENMTRLMAGDPAIVDTTDAQLRSGPFELPVLRVLIVGGRTDQDIINTVETAMRRSGAQ